MEYKTYILLEEYRGAECVPCTYEKFVRVCESKEVEQKITAFRTGMQQVKALEKSEQPERAKELKQKAYINKQTLPGFLFQAYDMDDNVYENKKKGIKKVGKYRKQGCAHCNGLAMIDIDDLAYPRELYHDQIMEYHGDLIKNGTILLAFITPSGHGLKLVFKCDPEKGNLIDNQLWLGNELGFTIDESCKDASRLSFAPRMDDVLYCDPSLFLYYNEEFDKKYTPLYNEGKSQPSLFPNGAAPKSSASPSSGQKKASKAPTSNGDSSASKDAEGESEPKDYSEYRYKGIAIPDIIDNWMKGEAPQQGERHNTLLALAKELKYVCERNDEIVKIAVGTGTWGIAAVIPKYLSLRLPCPCDYLDHGGGSSDHFHHYNFCITPNETPVNLDSWRSPAPIAFAVIRISLRLTFSRL